MNKDNPYDIVRCNIIYFRKKRGFTQAKLAELMDVDHDFVRQVESKKVKKNFSLQNVKKAADALGVELHELFIYREDI